MGFSKDDDVYKLAAPSKEPTTPSSACIFFHTISPCSSVNIKKRLTRKHLINDDTIFISLLLFHHFESRERGKGGGRRLKCCI